MLPDQINSAGGCSANCWFVIEAAAELSHCIFQQNIKGLDLGHHGWNIVSADEWLEEEESFTARFPRKIINEEFNKINKTVEW